MMMEPTIVNAPPQMINQRLLLVINLYLYVGQASSQRVEEIEKNYKANIRWCKYFGAN